MEQYSEAYKSRCVKRLKAWGAPVSGWKCVDMYDVVSGDGNSGTLTTCELCDCAQVRYVHVMRHDRYFEDARVGCICAGILDGDMLAAKERDNEMKNRAKRKRNYLKRAWRQGSGWAYTLRYKNRCLAIVSGRHGEGGFGVICDGKGAWRYKGQPIASFLTAVHAAFDIIDPPAGGHRK